MTNTTSDPLRSICSPLVVRRALLLTAACAAALASSARGDPATRPGTTRPATPLPLTIERRPSPVDSVRFVIGPDGAKSKEPADKVILLEPPPEYVDWFKRKSDSSALEGFRVEVLSFEHDPLVELFSLSDLHYGEADPKTGRFERGWEVRLLQSSFTGVNAGGELGLAGVVQVDVLPDHRYVFPYAAKIKVKPPADRSGAPLTPTSAVVTWSKPEAWTRQD